MNDITPATNTEMDESESCSANQGKRSFCDLQQEMPWSFGESSSMPAGKPALTVPSSEMSRATKAANSFDRRMRLLIASGLVCGITPTSIRRQLGVAIPAFVSSWQGGENMERPKVDC